MKKIAFMNVAVFVLALVALAGWIDWSGIP